jgi:hypothetical protein
MSDQPSSEKQVSSPKFLHPPWAVLVASGFVVALVAIVAMKVVGGWLGWVIWLVAWGVMVVLACIVTYKYAEFAKWALGWAVMMALMAPTPSAQFPLEGWGTPIDLGTYIVVSIIVGLIFTAIAKRHKSSSAG